MTPQQENQIKELREQKLTPKQIARKLGLKVSQVSQALKEKAEKAGIEMSEKGELDEIEECLVNSNCMEIAIGVIIMVIAVEVIVMAIAFRVMWGTRL